MRHGGRRRNTKTFKNNSSVDGIKPSSTDLFSSCDRRERQKLDPARSETETLEAQGGKLTRKGGANAAIMSPARNAGVCESVEVTESAYSFSSKGSSPESEELSALEFDDFFNMDDPSWKFEREAVSPLFEMGLDGFPDLASCLSADRGPDQLSGWLPDGDPSVGGAVRGRLPPVGSVQAAPPKEWGPGKINKNAIAARLNRQKKKEYVSGLESRVNSLAMENKDLKEENSHLNKRVEELEDEMRYLRAVLANESVLAQLLSRLTGVNGMKLSTSLFQESRKDEHDYALPRKRVKVEERETSGGVCLHVDKNHVSVEFCTKCAESASASFKM